MEYILEAPTGQGKSYNIARYALVKTFANKSISVIAVPSKTLVMQMVKELSKAKIDIGQEFPDVNMDSVAIDYHIMDKKIEENVLLDYYKKGDAVIVTVFQYIKKFDDFENVTSFHALFSLFAPTVNLFVDEADKFMKFATDREDMIIAQVFQNDHVDIPSTEYFYNDWRDRSSNDKLISLDHRGYKKVKRADSPYVIERNLGEFEKEDLYITCEVDENSGSASLILTEKGNTELNSHGVDVFSSSKTQLGKMFVIDKIEIDDNIHKNACQKLHDYFIYNTVASYIRFMYSLTSPRKLRKLEESFTDICKRDLKEVSEVLFNEIYNFVFINNTLDHVSLKKEQRDKLESHFKNYYEKYKMLALKRKALFLLYEHKTANKAFLYKVICARFLYLNSHFSTARKSDIEISWPNENGDMFTMKIQTPTYKGLWNKKNFILSVDSYLKNKELSRDITKILKNKKLYELKRNKVSAQEGAKYWESYEEDQYVGENLREDKVIITSEMLGKKSLNRVKEIIKNSDSEDVNSISLSLITRITQPKHLGPMGVDLFIAKSENMWVKTLCSTCLLTSATYDPLLIHHYIGNMESYLKQLSLPYNYKMIRPGKNEKKIDTLYVIASEYDLFSKTNKKLMYGKYWSRFGELFYSSFYENKSADEERYAFVAVPSNAKVRDYYSKYQMNEYFEIILGSDEISGLGGNYIDYTLSKINSEDIFSKKKVLKLISVFGNASTGINVPKLIYLYLSTNNYRPNHINFSQSLVIGENFVSSEFYTIVKSIIQCMGRLTRTLPNEKRAIKILEIKIQPPKEFMAFKTLVLPEMLNISHEVCIVDLNVYEQLFFIVTKTNSGTKIIDAFEQDALEAYADRKDAAFHELGETLAFFKIEFIRLLKQDLEKECFDEEFLKLSKKYITGVLKFLHHLIISTIYKYNFAKGKKTLKSHSYIKQRLSIFKNELFGEYFDQYMFISEILKTGQIQNKRDYIKIHGEFHKPYKDETLVNKFAKQLYNKTNLFESFFDSYFD